jgi:hypothetical protein
MISFHFFPIVQARAMGTTTALRLRRVYACQLHHVLQPCL